MKSSAPEEEEKEHYTVLEQDGLTVWVSNGIEFENDEVVIDLTGLFFMVIPMAISAILLPQESGCAGCRGCGTN